MKTTTQTILTLLFVFFLASCSPDRTIPAPTDETAAPAEPATPSDSETTTDSRAASEEKSAPHTIPDGTYTLDSAHSTLTYTASRIAGTPHVGTVSIRSGAISLSSPNAKGTFTIDMTSITESKNNTRFLTHLASKDFFDAETYPDAHMNINSLAHHDGNSYTVNGDLTIRNTTQPLQFPATLALDGKTLHATANFTIDRTRWNITYDSGSIFSELGDRAIKDEIGFSLDLTFFAP